MNPGLIIVDEFLFRRMAEEPIPRRYLTLPPNPEPIIIDYFLFVPRRTMAMVWSWARPLPPSRERRVIKDAAAKAAAAA